MDIKNIYQKDELWETFLSDYKYREGQKKATLEIWDTLHNKRLSLIEAPTGVGKSLSYLVPSLMYLDNNPKEKIFISTENKMLQDQLLEKDIPLAKQILGLKANMVKTSIIKGRNKYVCLKKFTKILKTNQEEKLAYLYLKTWLLKVESGDLEKISYRMQKNNNALNNMIERIRSDFKECLLSCSSKEECKYQQQQKKMRQSQLILINHALLANWPEKYSDIKNLISDEAHELEKAYLEGSKLIFSYKEITFYIKSLYHEKNNDGILRLLALNYNKHFTPSGRNIFNECKREINRIIEALKSNKKIVALGSKGLFQGADIKGEALSCVIIERVPFLSFQDPVSKKKIDIIGNDDFFTQEQLPHAGIMLRQMFGRLIRSQNDKGYVIVLNKLNYYANKLIRDLPQVQVIRADTNTILGQMKRDFKQWNVK